MASAGASTPGLAVVSAGLTMAIDALGMPAATSAAFGKPDGAWQRKFVEDRAAPLADALTRQMSSEVNTRG